MGICAWCVMGQNAVLCGKCRDRKARKREVVVLAKMGSIRYKTALGFWGT